MPFTAYSFSVIWGFGWLYRIFFCPTNDETEQARQKLKNSRLFRFPLLDEFEKGEIKRGAEIFINDEMWIFMGAEETGDDCFQPEDMIFYNSKRNCYYYFNGWLLQDMERIHNKPLHYQSQEPFFKETYGD